MILSSASVLFQNYERWVPHVFQKWLLQTEILEDEKEEVEGERAEGKRAEA